jgi:hypothetical protein
VEGEVSLDLLVRLGRGDIVPKRGIKWLQGGLVRFVGGSAVEADAIIYCTSYKVSFPFFDPGSPAAPGNDLPLWQRRGQARTTSSSWAFCSHEEQPCRLPRQRRS